MNIVAISLSSATAVTQGKVLFWPQDITLSSYKFIMQQKELIAAFLITLKRVALGVTINMILTVLVAYPLSKEAHQFPLRTFYVWFFVLTMLIHGGLIPSYIIVKETGLIDSIWALVLPGALPVFNVVLLLNFFRALPKELDEAAKIDGAGQLVTLLKIYVPLSMPSLATLILFSTVGHWNSWFDGLIYMNRPDNYPLQSFLQTVVIKLDLTHVTDKDISLLKMVSDRTNRAAQIVVGMIPILLVYPFLQKYFVKGVVLGSVKE
jgi:putative aldouronate transport system permease protein